MKETGFVWECSCGHVEFGEEQPEECVKCGKLNSFIEIPNEIIAQRKKEDFDEIIEEEIDFTVKDKLKNKRKNKKTKLIKKFKKRK